MLNNRSYIEIALDPIKASQSAGGTMFNESHTTRREGLYTVKTTMVQDSHIEVWTISGKLHRTNGPARIVKAFGVTLSEEWYHENKCHRTNGPAVINYYNGQLSEEIWYQNGERYREDGGPTHVTYHKNGQPSVRMWMGSHGLHRVDGPAEIYYNDKGEVTAEQWYNKNVLTRTDGPANIQYYANGSKMSEEWCLDEFLHRTDGPACSVWSQEGNIVEQQWRIDGKLHRTNGPAAIYNDPEEGPEELHFLKGEYYTPEAYQEFLDVYSITGSEQWAIEAVYDRLSGTNVDYISTADGWYKTRVIK